MINEKELIFVIPAYNEEMNIEQVIDEIKEEFKESSIIVINDCSKDRTKEIVEAKGVPCISHPFNMGYAMGVQSGIKYAKMHEYKYVIQFDADRQHIAAEARKLIKIMEEKNCNIVIGSRFLKENQYEQTFFRKLGTKIFSFLIKVFCHKKMSDPTSGFQLLDQKAIDRFSKFEHYPEFPDANLIIELLYAGFHIEEVSVKMRKREAGESMHKGILKPIKYMIQILYTIIIILLRNVFRKKEVKQ